MITTLQFARALEQALAYKLAGMSRAESAMQACRTTGISPEWALIIQLALDSSQSLCEDWINRQINSALDRAYSNEGAFH